MYEITLTIPIYNAEKYLRDLLESIIAQTMDFRKIEVIMIDDCSTDNSVSIMEEYSNQYDNFISVKLPTNSGVAGHARNEGVKRATGKYLMFADSDDFLPKNACETLFKAMEEKNADFITANYINADEDGTVWDKPIFNTEKYQNFKLSITDYTKSFFILNSSVCNKIFKKDFIREHDIRFLEGVPAEDAYFTNSSFLNSNHVYYLQDVIYCYRQRNKNTENRSVSFACSTDYFDKINQAYHAIYEKFKEYDQIKFYRYTYAKNMSYMLYKFIDSQVLTDEERMDIMKKMKWFYELSHKLKVPACQLAQKMIVDEIVNENYKQAVNYCKIVADIRSYVPKEVRENMSRPDAEMYQRISKYDEEY